MDTNIILIVLYIFVIVVALLFATFILRKIMFLFNPVFALLNYIQWVRANAFETTQIQKDRVV